MSTNPPSHDWQSIKTLASEAWAQPAAQRARFIEAACGSDRTLGAEVVALVESMTAAEHWFEDPLPWPTTSESSLTDLAGHRIGPYEIVARIGAGGMGEVYRARDTRLDRAVAIKVVSGLALLDPAARTRFDVEARAVATLNHPHICTLYDVGHDDGLDYLVMEFVEGETLAARLAAGPLPKAEALQYAEEIGSALTEAHRAGVVHCDVKPGNIMLAPTEGPGSRRHAKLLDFGLASIGVPARAFTRRDPEPGVLLSEFVFGTALYMAPERLAGDTGDARSDVFAFGAVLFEMLAGRPAFPEAARLGAAPSRRPHLGVMIPTSWPASLARLVARCLAETPDARSSSMDEVLADLRRIRARTARAYRRRAIAAAAALVLIVGVGLIWLTGRVTGKEHLAPIVTRLPASAGVIGAPAIAPDGSAVVFLWVGPEVDNPELMLLAPDSPTRRRLTTDPGVEEWPAWSPDGKRLAFIRCGARRCGIVTMSAQGGGERRVLDLREDRYLGLAWSPDGQSIAYAQRNDGPATPYAVFLLDVETGISRQVTTPPPGSGDVRFAFSPDGRSLALIRFEDAIGVAIVSLTTGTTTSLLRDQHEWFGGVAWSADGQRLILSADQRGVRHLWALPVTGGTLQQLAVAGEHAYYPAMAMGSARLAYVRHFRDWDLAQILLDRTRATTVRPFPSSPRIELDPAISPDGSTVAFASERGGPRELWLATSDGRDARRLIDRHGVGRPSWSPDGQHLAFQAGGIFVVPVGGGTPRRLATDGEIPTWSADGQTIYFVLGFRIWKVPVAGGQATQVLQEGASAARESPDGKKLYYSRLDGGIWRVPVAGGVGRLVVPEFKSSLPGYWTVGAEGIYYLAGDAHPHQQAPNDVRFFDVARNRTTTVATVTGFIDEWIGGFALSPDRRMLMLPQRTYESSEVVLIDHVR